MRRASKRPLFTVIALLLPLVMLALIEYGLRLAGYGRAAPLFIKNPVHGEYVLPRPDILTRYFPEKSLPRVTMETNFFLANKPAHALRLFVQGGSTAAGFPYGLGASPAGMLGYRLRQTFPEHHVEVVNTAMSAVNSYLLVEMADEIVAQQPDAILIYAGHNEYLGIFGAGSAFSMGGQWLTRAYLQLADLAITDFIQQLLPGKADTSANATRTFMAQIADDTHIPLHSDRYQHGLEQFESNMENLLDTYHDAGIPVFLSTIASNIRDQAPFVSDPEYGNADRAFRQGRALAAANDIQRARAQLESARDNDLLRFRAPSDINTIIRRLATRDGVTLIDAEAALVARSPQGLIGNTLMLEHLHPNLPGYFIIADAFYDAVIEAFNADRSHYVSADEAWQQRLVTQAEEYSGYAQIQALKADFPFSETPSPLILSAPADWQQQLGKAYFEKRLSWFEMIRSLHDGFTLRNRSDDAFKTALILADALPHDPLYNEQAGDYCFSRKRMAEALYYYQRAKRAGATSTHTTRRVALLSQRLNRANG